MRNRFLQVILIPEDGGEVRSYRFPAGSLRAAGFVILALLLLLATSLGFHAKTFRDAHRLRSLQAENRALTEQIGDFRAAADELEKAIGWAGEAEREARLLAGLDPLDVETRRLGIGGPEMQVEPSQAIRPGPLRAGLRDEGRRLDQLRRQVSFQKQSYAVVLRTLRERKEQLSRTPTISPIRNGYTLTSRFGWRTDPFTGRRAHHNGLDYRAIAGSPVLATAKGIVSFVGYNGDFGLSVKLKHGDGVETVYCHLKSARVKAGDAVERGDEIGGVGNTGRSTGTHLHYEVRLNGRAVDPSRYILTPSLIVD